MVISTVLIGSHPKDTLLNLQNRLSCHPLAGKFYRAVSVVKPILHCRFKVITSPKVDGIGGWGGGVYSYPLRPLAPLFHCRILEF